MELKSVRFFVDFSVQSRLGITSIKSHKDSGDQIYYVCLSVIDYSIFFSLMPSSSSSCRMTKYMSAQPTMKPSTIPISSLRKKKH